MEIRLKMVGFDYEDADIAEEINRNICALFSTPAGTCAGDRGYGLQQAEFLGKLAPVAENALALEVMEKVSIYEPRAEVLEVSCVSDPGGQLVATIRIGPNEDYNPEEEEETDEDETEEDDEDEDEDESEE